MAAPVTGEAGLTEDRFDSHIVISKLKTPNSAEDNLIIAQLSKTVLTRPNVPCASSVIKRRKTKPMRFEASRTDVQKEHHSPKIKIQVLSDPSVPCLSLTKEKSPTKGFKTPVPNSPAMIRAVEVQLSLGIEFPSCIKIMVRSQVSCGFWMGLPVPFCRSFLPKEDASFLLEDEKGEQCEVKYIAYKSGLSAGWKKFAVSHNLIEGDVLVFHLVEPWKFKVYILKTNVSNEVDGALSLLNLEAHTEQMTPVTPSPKTKRSKHTEPLSLTVVEKKHKKTSLSSRSIPPQLSSHRIEHSGNDSEEVASEVLETSRPAKTDLPFQEVKSFGNFRILVNGTCIDSELPEDVRVNYYKLCNDKKQFLHDGLREGLYYKLVAGMIGETVSIANEIKNCKPATTKEEFGVWDDSLKSFELLGMKVGFLRDRIHILATLVSEGALDIKRYVEAKNEQKRTEDEIKELSEKISELKETALKFERVSGSLKRKAEKYEHRFRDALGAPW